MRPVLALVLPGATSEVLATTSGGWLANPRDADELETTLVGIYGRWADGTLRAHHANMDVLRRFDRRNLTRELAAIFDTAVRAGGPRAAVG
jgi:hypothetical protein